MFSTKEKLDKKTGTFGVGRLNFLQSLVTEFQDTDSQGIYGQFHIREIKIENYEVEYIYTRVSVWVSGAHQFTGFRTVSYFKM